ncbi:Protein RETICULATA-related 4, chloroplastic [Vitis vinifera]|uniref:Protein RETICULATA-related 4, chloroplastic n=1 Tax=Vitis vinifera TaxID=29760 RepID=A0A438IKK5_VITVI|nr:Protein RETICULATA-related 4, chloroplastic [Vitis vinifera]
MEGGSVAGSGYEAAGGQVEGLWCRLVMTHESISFVVIGTKWWLVSFEQRILEPMLHKHKLLLSALCFAVRTGNTFLGSLLWVDYARWVGVQKVQEDHGVVLEVYSMFGLLLCFTSEYWFLPGKWISQLGFVGGYGL